MPWQVGVASVPGRSGRANASGSAQSKHPALETGCPVLLPRLCPRRQTRELGSLRDSVLGIQGMPFGEPQDALGDASLGQKGSALLLTSSHHHPYTSPYQAQKHAPLPTPAPITNSWVAGGAHVARTWLVRLRDLPRVTQDSTLTLPLAVTTQKHFWGQSEIAPKHAVWWAALFPEPRKGRHLMIQRPSCSPSPVTPARVDLGFGKRGAACDEGHHHL